MSEQKWTAEPWRMGMLNGHNADTIYGNDLCATNSDSAVASVFGVPRHKHVDDLDRLDERWQRGIANAERAIACVNALTGIPDPAAAIREAREALYSNLAEFDAIDATYEGKYEPAWWTAWSRQCRITRAALRALGGA